MAGAVPFPHQSHNLVFLYHAIFIVRATAVERETVIQRCCFLALCRHPCYCFLAGEQQEKSVFHNKQLSWTAANTYDVVLRHHVGHPPMRVDNVVHVPTMTYTMGYYPTLLLHCGHAIAISPSIRPPKYSPNLVRTEEVLFRLLENNHDR